MAASWWKSARDCAHCARPFEPARRDAQFCSVACRVAAHRRKNGAKSRTFSPRAPLIRNEIAALFVEARGVYFDLGADVWDIDRDAKGYSGPFPVVAHPPCGPWSRLRGLSTRQDRTCGPRAVELVRQYGGVLEHPKHSGLFDACGMPRPGEFPDRWGGRTIEVNQSDWGHPAQKATWLYFVGTGIPPLVPRGPAPTRRFSDMHRREASATPPRFAEYLVALAGTVLERDSLRFPAGATDS